MDDEHKTDYMEEEEDDDQFKTPQLQKKKKKKQKIAIETENHEEETMNIKVNVKRLKGESDTRVPPIVAYFATGYNPSAGNDEDDDRESPKVTVYKHKAETKKRLQVVVSPPGSSVEFVGSNHRGEQAARKTCEYRLGVFDKETHTLKILPIAHDKIFRLEPRVKSKERVESEASASEVVTEVTADNRIEKSNVLNSRYGTKKAVNQDKKRQALNLGDDPETQKLLEGKLSKVDVNEAALKDTGSVVARNIPPYDASATTPKGVYPIDKIIEKAEWGFLQDISRLLEEETGAVPDAYPSFVRNRLHKLRDIEDESEKLEVSRVLSLLTHLVKFKDLNSMNGFDSAKEHRFPGIIRLKCKTLFKDPDSDRMPEDKRNLLISYILVLALHVDEFKTDPEDIAKDLKMSTVDLRKHFEHLGCKISRGKTNSFVTLPVPLKFPQIRRMKRAR